MANPNRVDGAKRGYIKRQLREQGYLSEKVLAAVIEIIEDRRSGEKSDEFVDRIVQKLTLRQELTEYEESFLIDAILIP